MCSPSDTNIRMTLNAKREWLYQAASDDIYFCIRDTRTFFDKIFYIGSNFWFWCYHLNDSSFRQSRKPRRPKMVVSLLHKLMPMEHMAKATSTLVQSHKNLIFIRLHKNKNAVWLQATQTNIYRWDLFSLLLVVAHDFHLTWLSRLLCIVCNSLQIRKGHIFIKLVIQNF